jgi:hypothetical protein
MEMHGLAKPTATASVPALRAEASDIHKRAQALTAERAELALPSYLGDTAAKKRIADIDDERTLLNARLETIEAAIRTLHKTEHQTSWRKLLPQMERSLHAALIDLYYHWPGRLNRLMEGRQSHDRIALKQALEQLDRVERDAAREIADRMIREARGPAFDPSDVDDRKRSEAEKARRIEQRNGHVAEAVAEMLASNNVRRPKALEAAIARAQQRIAVGG